MPEISLLAGLRVLDFAAEPLAYAGRIFVELGAEVILVEPPGGAALRSAAPLVQSETGATVSSTFAAYAGGKRSVTIDETTAAGRALLARLIATADIALVPSDPQEAERRHLDERSLRALNERVIVTSATAFGLTGPRRHWRGSDATAWASTGMTFLMGDPDRPPVVPPVGLSNAVTSLNAAMGAMLALRSRRRSGRGQLVDVSMQEAVLSVSMEAGPQNALEGRVPQRVARARMPGMGLYDTDDGAVDMGAFLPNQWDALAGWIAEELGVEEATLDVFQGGIMRRVPYLDLINEWSTELASRYTKQEFFLEAQRRGVPVGPINSATDLLHDVQLEATGAWQEQPHPDAPSFRLPRGPLVVDGATAGTGPIPAPGEHDAMVLGPLEP
jgi:benzylsuccinate CoA-transferase BbsE subunit